MVTGGTGSLGTALTKRLLKTNVDVIRIFSRDEWKQTKMQEELNDPRLRFLIGDIRDKERLVRAMENIDIVFHTAALKHVSIAEYNPFEAVKTNVLGAQNVIESCFDNEVDFAVAIGTDKAVSPLNTYGATKLLMERIFIAANYYKGSHKTKFVCVRYGNVLGSRGSILPKFLDQITNNRELTITDSNMTRFNITMNQAVDLIFRVIKESKEGEVFIPKLKAFTVETLKDSILELTNVKTKIKSIPIRPGEKFHETLISENEINDVYETKNDYIIRSIGIENIVPGKKSKYKKAKLDGPYSSNKVKLLKKEELKKIILKEGLLFSK